MSTISNARPAARVTAGPSWTAHLRARLKRWWTSYTTWRIEQMAIHQLERMSDHDLRDIGVNRSEIAHAVSHEAVRDSAFRRAR